MSNSSHFSETPMYKKDGSNAVVWGRSIKIAAGACSTTMKNCIEKPNECDAAEDSFLRSMMLRRIPEDMWEDYDTSCPRAVDVWNKISKEAKTNIKSRKSQLLLQLRDLKWLENDTVRDLLSRAVSIKTQLALIGETISDSQILSAVRSALPTAFDDYQEKLTHAELRSDLKLYDTIEDLAVEEQILIAKGVDLYEDVIHVSSSSGAMAFMAGRKQTASGAPTCNYCKRPGHVIAKCWNKMDADQGVPLGTNKKRAMSRKQPRPSTPPKYFIM